MTEYELYDVTQSTVSNVLANQALFLTLVSTYCVVAYSAGSKLSIYQVSFVNFVFIFAILVAQTSQVALISQVLFFGETLSQLDSSTGVSQNLGVATSWGLVTVRTIIVIGALIFMWQVRHSETE